MKKSERLGAEKVNVNGYQVSFTYWYYKESDLAAAVEYFGIFLVVFTCGAVILNAYRIGVARGLINIALSLLLNYPIKKCAAVLNDFCVRKKIRESADFAKYFAVTYPEHSNLCGELNDEYAVNPDAIPYRDFHPKRQLAMNIFALAGLILLFLIAVAFIAGCIWVKNYLEE